METRKPSLYYTFGLALIAASLTMTRLAPPQSQVFNFMEGLFIGLGLTLTAAAMVWKRRAERA